MYRIGLLCSTSTQIQTFIPVSQAFQASDIKYLWISLDKYVQADAGKALNRSQIEFVQFGEYSGRRFTDLSLAEMYRVIRDDLLPQIQDLYDQYHLDALVTGNDRGLIEKQFIRLARANCIKTMLIQDGIFWTTEVRSFRKNRRVDNSFKAYTRDIFKEVLSRALSSLDLSYLAPTYMGQGNCDEIAVMGRSTRRILAQRGVDVERIHVTGQPRFDRVLKSEQSPEDIRRRLDLPDGFIVTVFTSAYGTNLHSHTLQSKQERFVNELVRQLEEVNSDSVLLLIKPHPREPLVNYKVPADCTSVRLLLDASSIDVIAASDVVISVPSTVIVETCLYQKPLFVLNLSAPDGQQVSERLGLPSGAFREFTIEDCSDPAIWEELLSADKKTSGSVCDDLIMVPEEGAAVQTADLLLRLLESSDVQERNAASS